MSSNEDLIFHHIKNNKNILPTYCQPIEYHSIETSGEYEIKAKFFSNKHIFIGAFTIVTLTIVVFVLLKRKSRNNNSVQTKSKWLRYGDSTVCLLHLIT